MQTDDASSFFGGFTISVFGNYQWVLQLHMPYDTATEWLLKIFSTMILGIIGGMAGMFSKDLYKFIKKKITNNEQTNSNHRSGGNSHDSNSGSE